VKEVNEVTSPRNPSNMKSKIVLVDGSQLLRDMLTRVFRRLPDFEIVATLHDLAGLQPLLLSTEADWLVISAVPDEGVSKQVKALHARYPAMRILAIAADGSEVLVNWAEPHEAHMERASLHELIAMMRGQDQNASR